MLAIKILVAVENPFFSSFLRSFHTASKFPDLATATTTATEEQAHLALKTFFFVSGMQMEKCPSSVSSGGLFCFKKSETEGKERTSRTPFFLNIVQMPSAVWESLLLPVASMVQRR